MPAIDFPDVGITTGSIFTSEGKTWEFNGTSWELVASQERIGTGSIIEEKIANNAVTANKIASGAVTSGKIAAGAVLEAALANDSVTSSKIANNAVGTTEIADSSVTAGKLGSLAVTESKINDSAVTSDKINSAAVTEAKIADGAVTVNKIGTGAVTNAKLQNASLAVGSTAISLGSSASAISGLTDLSVDRFLTINQVREFVSLDATEPGAAKLYFYDDASVYYYNNPAANFTLDVRGENGGTSLTFNQLTSTGQIATITMLVKNGATPYYLTNMQIDSTNTGRTLYWQSGVVPSAGNANSIDVYTFVIIKRAAATYDVLANQTRFA